MRTRGKNKIHGCNECKHFQEGLFGVSHAHCRHPKNIEYVIRYGEKEVVTKEAYQKLNKDGGCERFVKKWGRPLFSNHE